MRRSAFIGRAAIPALLLTGLLAVPTAPADPVAVVDDTGVTVRVGGPAERIVTLSPHATELVIAAGAGDRLVAVDRFSDLPAGDGDVARIAAAPLDRETLLQLRPDLVVAWHSGTRPADAAWLRRQAIALFASEPDDLADIADALRAIGRLAGVTTTAAAAARRFETAIDTPCTALAPQTAYVVVWDDPPMTVGGRHWLNAALAAAGYRNAFANVDRAIFTISDEALLTTTAHATISLMRQYDDSPNDRLARQLSRPGPALGEAVAALCRQHLAARVDGEGPRATAVEEHRQAALSRSRYGD